MNISLRKLEITQDARGTLFEILRPEHVGNAPFGQLLVTTAKSGETKGGHYHKRKREWYLVTSGKGLLILDDPKTGEHEEIALDSTIPTVAEMPIGVIHRIKNIGRKELSVLVYVSESFNPSDPDTYTEYHSI